MTAGKPPRLPVRASIAVIEQSLNLGHALAVAGIDHEFAEVETNHLGLVQVDSVHELIGAFLGARTEPER